MATQIHHYRILANPGAGSVISLFLYGAGGETVVANFQETAPAKGATRASSGQRYLHFPMSRYLPVLDMLRNEGPVFVLWKDGDPPQGALQTGEPEPVGEGE